MPNLKFLAVPFLAMFLTACALVQPVEVAETPAQKAYALSGTYNVLLETAAELVADPLVNEEVKVTIQLVEARTTPVVNSLDNAYANFVVEKARFDAGQSDVEKLDIATANLERWVVLAEDALLELATAIQGD